jgi:hypothetical protein
MTDASRTELGGIAVPSHVTASARALAQLLASGDPENAIDRLEALFADVYTTQAHESSAAYAAPAVDLDSLRSPLDRVGKEWLDGRARIASRHLEGMLRAIARQGRDASIVGEVLAGQAIRFFLEARAAAILARINRKRSSVPDPSADATLALANQLAHQLLVAATTPERNQQLARLIHQLDKLGVEGRAKDVRGAAINPVAEKFLMRLARGEQGGSKLAVIRSRLLEGAGLKGVEHLLFDHVPPIVQRKQAAADQDKKEAGGVVFDISTNQWTQRDKSFGYPIELGQLFQYVIRRDDKNGVTHTIIDAPAELVARLRTTLQDPMTGDFIGSLDSMKVDAFIGDLVAIATQGSDDPEIASLLAEPIDLFFSTTNGTKVPVSVQWDLDAPALTALVRGLTEPSLRAAIARSAEAVRALAAEKRARLERELGDLFREYPGVGKQHERAHAALINMGEAQQSVLGLSKDDGLLPLSRTVFKAEHLETRYKDADHLKVRFLIIRNTDLPMATLEGLDVLILDDDFFRDIWKRAGFPPNHELLSFNNLIVGSGYLVLDHGQIPMVEDDRELCPDKLPPGLPPAKVILRRLHFKLDEAAIAEAEKRMISFEQLKKLLPKIGAVTAPADSNVSADSVRERVWNVPTAQRPGEIARAIMEQLAAREGGAQSEEARKEVAAWFAQIFHDFEVNGTTLWDFREGHLPPHLKKATRLTITDEIAQALVDFVAKAVKS